MLRRETIEWRIRSSASCGTPLPAEEKILCHVPLPSAEEKILCHYARRSSISHLRR